MILDPGSSLLDTLYWVTLLAVFVSSSSGVLKAGLNKFDLFGVIIIATTTGLGGGSMRDLLLGRDVFWITDQTFFIASLSSALLIFVLARFIAFSTKYMLVADAGGLATFGIAGTLVALILGAPYLIASFMGVITGIMGGIFRDILCKESPVVFSSPLYATVLWLGSLLFIALLHFECNVNLAAFVSGVSIFVSRLLALYFGISLPKFRFKC